MMLPRCLSALLVCACTGVASLGATSNPVGIDLFADGSLAGWSSYLEKHGKDSDPDGNFKLQGGVLTIRGKDFGYIATKDSFKNYRLRAEFKWGQAQWAPRETGKRDSGILYHFPLGAPDEVWPKSIECQIQEGDCGDVWFVNGTSARFDARSEFAWGMVHVFRSADHEKPRGEWNVVEVVCRGDRFEHWVNGHKVAEGWGASVSEGRILLQSEGAEVFYRNVTVTPLE